MSALAIEHYKLPPVRDTDMYVAVHSTFSVFTPMTDRAEAWLEEHLDQLEPGLVVGPYGLAADHRPAQRIVRAMSAAGLTVQIQRGDTP